MYREDVTCEKGVSATIRARSHRFRRRLRFKEVSRRDVRRDTL
jgi:hypothetical protein